MLPSAADTVTFTPVQVRDVVRPDPGTIEVCLTTGERLVITGGTSADLVRTVVVVALRAPC